MIETLSIIITTTILTPNPILPKDCAVLTAIVQSENFKQQSDEVKTHFEKALLECQNETKEVKYENRIH